MSPKRDNNAKAWRAISDRCQALKLVIWRANPAGLIISEPELEGIYGLWLSSTALARRVAMACADIDPSRPTSLIELDEGCWLLPLAESRRRRVHGYTLALAIGPDVTETELFDEVCKGARIDRAAMRAAAREWTVYDKVGAERTLEMLRWMLDDQQELASGEASMQGFVDRLTESYETIDLLYALGHEMNKPGDPEQFIKFTLDRLIEGTNFRWVSALIGADSRRLTNLRDTFHVSGEPTMDPDSLERSCRRMLAMRELGREVSVLSDVDGFEPLGGPQVVALPVMRDDRHVAWIMAGEKTGLDPQVSSYDTHLLEAAGGHLGPFLENAALYEDQRRLFMGTLTALSAAIDAKDPYTQGHSERVAHLSAQLAGAIGLDEERVERIRIAGLVHDVGKIGVSEAVLRKPGKLTSEEFAMIREHPSIGHRILREIDQLEDVLPGVLYHHERYDGKGYPHGLSGDDIPLVARIIGVADTFDAMSSNRAYRPALKREKVLDEIKECGGTQFDPKLSDLFIELDLARYDEMVADARSQEPEATNLREAA